MYAVALLLSAATTLGTTELPYFHLGAVTIPGIHLDIQSFGMLVAAGVLIGAGLLRRYGEWHGVSDDHIRKLIGWVTLCGFLGAHEFDMIAYNWDKIGEATGAHPASWWFLPDAAWPSNWPLPLRMWEGISSYGGFIGGTLGFFFYVWWKRLPWRLMADVAIVGVLPAFSIGRIGCTVVSDHIGAAVDPHSWYAFLAMDYPPAMLQNLHDLPPAVDGVIKAWNLGLIEFLYLIPVNVVVLWLAFRPTKRLPAGFLIVLSAVLYAPVRFLLDFLRPAVTDPRYGGLTFAQWSSIGILAAAGYAAVRILNNGQPAEPITRTSREAQERLRKALTDTDGDVPKLSVAVPKDDAVAQALRKVRAPVDQPPPPESASKGGKGGKGKSKR